MALATQSDDNVQWTVKNTGKTESGASTYELREVATGKTKTIVSDPEATAAIEKLVQNNLEMLKRLADR